MREVFLWFVAFVSIIGSCKAKSYATSEGDLGACDRFSWKCSDGQCIDALRKCDGIHNCEDSSDEVDCHKAYCEPSSHFYCESGECVDNHMLCDGAIDCFNEEDEYNCNNTNTCHEHQFQCADGNCINYSLNCNGKNDCADASDENHCTVKKCDEGYFQCKNLKCIPNNFFCDGQPDCEDGEDEINCGNSTMCTAEHGFFSCDGQKCLGKEHVCDGVTQCDDKSDENGHCDTTCESLNPPCQHDCFRTPLGPKCICGKGFKLLRNSFSCQDIDECKGDSQVCDHFCHNVKGKFKCSCAKDYMLMRDESSCIIGDTGEDSAVLIFSVGNSIEAKRLDNSFKWIVWDGDMKTSGVAYDPDYSKIYWITHEDKVLFKSFQKKEEPKVFIEGLKKAENIVIDWFGRNLYVADKGRNHILVCNLDSVQCTSILKNLSGPRSLQVDLENKYLYWTEVHSHTIQRSGLDGSQKITLIKDHIVWPNGLFIDHPAKKIYWVDAMLDKIDSCDFSGKTRKSLPHKASSHAYSLAVWEDRIYWTDSNSHFRKEIRSCRKRDGSLPKIEHEDKHREVSNLAVYHPSMFKYANNPCKHLNGIKCSHLCLLSPSDEKGYICSCPEEMLLDKNAQSCNENPGNKIPLVAAQSNLFEVPLRTYGRSPLLSKYGKLDLGDIADIDYNPIKNTVYIANPKEKKISVVDLSLGTVEKFIDNIELPIAVSVDWLRDNIYWIDSLHHTVNVARSSVRFRSTIIKHLRRPTDISLDVIDGYLYVSDASLSPSITKCELSGKKCFEIAEHDMIRPFSLCIDQTVSPKRIYWTDSETNKIESVDVYGKNRKSEFHNLRSPMKIYVDDIIVWSEKNSKALNIATKKPGNVKKIPIELSSDPVDTWYMSLTMIGGPKPNLSLDPCTGNKKCHQFCFSKTSSHMDCGCTEGLILDSDNFTCVTKCSSHQATCGDGACMAKLLWCDGSLDCKDGSDEANCTKCKSTEFRCTNGDCIPTHYKCDGISDCADNSDEASFLKCEKPCEEGKDEWRCLSGDCIPSSWVCNEKLDCSDGSDEKKCKNNSCPDGKRRCGNGNCMSEQWWCDGKFDCSTGEDEIGCACKLGEYKCTNGLCMDKEKLCSGKLTCDDGHFNLNCSDKILNHSQQSCEKNYIPCNNSTDPECIPIYSWCNKVSDCTNNEDEQNCSTVCVENEVKCESGRTCIPISWRCDNVEDCSDGSDEKACSPESKEQCGSNEFECSDGKCIPQYKVCNGIAECSNTEDEFECRKCDHNNGGCEQICNEVSCSCRDGYKLSSNGFNCSDINECDDDEACHHICRNHNGSFTCTCEPHYNIMSDGITCKPTNGEHWSIALISKRHVNYLDEDLDRTIDEEIPKQIFSNNMKVIYDPQNKDLIFIDGEAGNIYRKSSNWKKELSTIKNVTATSFDYINRNVYLVEIRTNNVIHRNGNKQITSSTVKIYNLETRNLGELFAILARITAIEYSSVTNKIITCETNNDQGSIVSRSTDVNSAVVLASGKIRSCESLAIDNVKRRVYWLDSSLNRIESVDFLGHRRRKFQSDMIQNAERLSLLKHSLLWLNVENDMLVKCSMKYPKNCTEFYYPNVNSVVNIKPIYDLSLENPCHSPSTCPYICVPHAFNIPHCVCEYGQKFQNGTCVTVSNFGPELPLLKGDCADGPCGAGECEQKYEEYFICRCPAGSKGSYCEVSSRKILNDNTTVVVVTIMVLLFILVLVIFFIFFYKYQCRFCSKNKSPYTRFRFTNPSFVLRREEASSTCPLTPPFSRLDDSENSTLEKQHSNTSNDSAIVIDQVRPLLG